MDALREPKPSRIDPVSRFVIGLSLLAATCGSCARSHRLPEIAVSQINPAPIWQLWGQRAIDCARAVSRADSGNTFVVVHDSVNIYDLVWILVATEQTDGGFPCRNGVGKVGSCAGLFRQPDSILIAAPRHGWSTVVAHEVLHWAVESVGEREWYHGLPWGLCEYV